METRFDASTGTGAPASGSANDPLLQAHMQEIIQTVRQVACRTADPSDLKFISTALKEVAHALNLFAPYKNKRKISIFGSARTAPSEAIYRQSARFSRRMVEAGFMVMTGAGDGIMRAAQEGAGREKSFGLNIVLPFEQSANVFIKNDPKLMHFKYFFTRKLFFVKEANAIALLPGGFGTLDEGLEVLTLLQTGKIHPIPVVFLDAPGGDYWIQWKNHVERFLLQRGLVSPDDMALFQITDDVDTAVEWVVGFYRNYHSLWFDRTRMVIRTTRAISDTRLASLNTLFSDILISGDIHRSAPLPDETDLPLTAVLHRLVFHFNQRQFGRLRQLIDAINASSPPE